MCDKTFRGSRIVNESPSLIPEPRLDNHIVARPLRLEGTDTSGVVSTPCTAEILKRPILLLRALRGNSRQLVRPVLQTLFSDHAEYVALGIMLLTFVGFMLERYPQQ